MELILFNGKIHTLDTKKEVYEAIAIDKELIIKVGKNEDILPLKTKNTTLIDLQGKTVIPGFNDSHMHLYSTGKNLQRVNLLGVNSIEEVKAKVKDFINNNSLLKFIKGRGWNQDYFQDEARFLTKDDLDEISKDYPILLLRACGHIGVVNSKALELIDANVNIDGGYVDYEKGILYENALSLLEDDESIDDIKETLQKAIVYANSFGITSVQTDDFQKDYQKVLSAYLELHQEKKLTCRVYEQCLLPNLEILEDFLKNGYYSGYGDDYFKIGPLKLLLDGSLGARTAALTKPYCDDLTTSGLLTYDDYELEAIMKYANSFNMQIAVHCIGDKAMKQALAIFHKLHNPLRPSIIHCQIMDEEIQNQFQALQVLALIQPIFLHYDHRIVEKRVGEDLARTSYAFKTLLNKGVKLALGTDSPIDTINPFANLYCAITRKDLEGNPPQGWNPQEKLTLDEALQLYTQGSSYASFEENKKGIIKSGFFADMIVLNQDIFNITSNQLLKTEVEYTIVGGKIVYQKK
ncbi:MAG TPA: amidohydrolase [Bacilli bacterium]